MRSAADREERALDGHLWVHHVSSIGVVIPDLNINIPVQAIIAPLSMQYLPKIVTRICEIRAARTSPMR